MVAGLPYWLTFPFSLSAAMPGAAEYFQLERPVRDWIELWWRVKQMTMSFTFTYDGHTTTEHPTLERQFFGLPLDGDERDLRRPEILTAPGDPLQPISGVWTGSIANTNWNGFGGSLLLDITLRFFFTGKPEGTDSDGPSDFAWWENEDEVHAAFSLYFFGTYSTPGLESELIIRTAPEPALALPYRKTAGGQAFGLSFLGTQDDELDAPAAVVDSIEYQEWYSWDGTWNELTGARIA